jgi:hypothetical protein
MIGQRCLREKEGRGSIVVPSTHQMGVEKVKREKMSGF